MDDSGRDPTEKKIISQKERKHPRERIGLIKERQVK